MNMRLTALCMALCLLLSACAPTAAPETSTGAVSFTDDLGRTVTVNSPQRVAALLGSFAQVWMLAGGTVCAAADDAWDDFALDLPEDAVNLGNTKSLSLELLFAAQPDFILASTNTRQNLEWRDTLESTGIPVAYFDASDFDGYLRLLKICTEITGCPEHYETYGQKVQEQVEAVLGRCEAYREKRDAPVVLSLRASASSLKAKGSEGNVLGEMLASMGCINLADTEESLLENLSIEYILEMDPAFILIARHGDDAEGTRAYVEQYFEDHPAWAQLTAVQNGNVFYMDKMLFSMKPNHRWGEAYEQLEEILFHE